MKPDKNIIIIVLLSVNLGLSLYLFSKVSLLEKQNLILMQRGPHSEKGKSGQVKDPYIQNQVKNTIRKKLEQIQSCYSAFLKTKPEKSNKIDKSDTYSGSVKVDWHIDSDGKVVSPEIVASNFKDESLDNCLLNTIEKWKFPPPPFGMEKYVEHSFKFVE